MSGRAIQSARIGLLAAVVYTVAMSLSAFVNWYYNADTIIAWVLYGTLGSLASIIALYGGYYLSKGEYALRMSFLFFIIMAISNFLDEITQNAAEIQLSEFWFIGGMFIFLASLIYNKIKLNRQMLQSIAEYNGVVEFIRNIFALLGLMGGILLLWGRFQLSAKYQTKKDSRDFEERTDLKLNKHETEMMEMRSEAKIQRVEMKSDMNTIRFHLEALNKHQDKWDKTAETMLHKLNNALNVDIQKTVKYLIDEHKNQK